MDTILLCDIGGTNVRVSTFCGDRINNLKRYKTSSFSHLHNIIRDYCTDTGRQESFEVAAFAIAGFVKGNKATLTATGQVLSVNDISSLFEINETILLNDYQAIAKGIDALPKENCKTLRQSSWQEKTQLIVCGAGTGLGAAIRLADGRVLSTEAGHTGLPYVKDLQGYTASCDNQFRIYENILSGNGLSNLYREISSRLRGKSIKKTPEEIISDFANPHSPAVEVTKKIFEQTLGNFCKSLALFAVETRDIFITGGLIRDNLKVIFGKEFHEAFNSDPAFFQYLNGIGIHVIEDDLASFYGLAEALKEHRRKLK